MKQKSVTTRRRRKVIGFKKKFPFSMFGTKKSDGDKKGDSFVMDVEMDVMLFMIIFILIGTCCIGICCMCFGIGIAQIVNIPFKTNMMTNWQ